MIIEDVIEELLAREGGYVNDPNDRGGETNWGITIGTARSHGYAGPMRDLPRATAKDIYRRIYVAAPGFDKVGAINAAIGGELVDTGVNMGVAIAGRFLQRSLNALNRQGRDFADLVVDDKIGPRSLDALSAYMLQRGKIGETVLLRALNGLQVARYIEIAEGRSANETFVFGWLRTRVVM